MGPQRAVRSKVGGRRSGRGWTGLAERVSASLLPVHVCRSFDPLDLQDGIVTAKLRPKEDSDCGPFRSSAFVHVKGEDEPEQVFKVQSREAILTISC